MTVFTTVKENKRKVVLHFPKLNGLQKASD